MIFHTENELCANILFWQGELGLLHWQIAARLARMEDMGDVRAGEIEFVRARLQANIKILCADHYPIGPHKQDQQETVIHELLHLVLSAFQPANDTEEHIQFENAITLISRALAKKVQAIED